MIQYNKLVRDRIPEIIKEHGRKFSTRLIEGAELTNALTSKLHEELAEFEADHSLEELADLLEVVYALGDNLGFSKDELESVRRTKAESNGAFKNGILLVEAEAK